MGYFADHAADGQIRKYRLFYLGLNTPVYWTECDIDLYWNSHTWQAAPIQMSSVNNQPSGATATFEYGDADGSVFTSLASQNGGELALAAIYEAGFLLTNKTNVPDEVLQIFSGRIDRVAITTAARDVLTFTLMPPALTQAATLPQRLLSSLLRT